MMAKCYDLPELGDVYHRHYPVLPVLDIVLKLKIKVARGFPGSPVVKVIVFPRQGHGVPLWLGN